MLNLFCFWSIGIKSLYKGCLMINGVNASVVSTNALNREVLNRQNENTEVKEKEQVQQLSRAEQIKEQIKNGEYKIDLQQTSEKMASNLLNL